MFLFSERILCNSEEFCEKNLFDIYHCVNQCPNLPVICLPFVTLLKQNLKIFADRTLFLKFERIIANEWRKNQKFHFNENTTGFRPQVIRVRNQLPITRNLYSGPQVHQ